jgi:hypothetical protein
LGYDGYRRRDFQDYGKLNNYLGENLTKPPDAESNGT